MGPSDRRRNCSARREGQALIQSAKGLGDAQATVFNAFHLIMLQGKDMRPWTLDDRREQVSEIVPGLDRQEA